MSGTVTAPADRHLADIARGGVLGLAGSAVAGLGGFALVAVVARGLPLDRAGTFFVITAAFLLLQGLSAAGTDTGLARFLLRHEAAGRGDHVLATVRGALTVSTGAAAVVAVAGIAVSGQLGAWLGWPSDAVAALRIALCALPAALLADGCLATARALTEMRSTVLVDRLLRAGSQPLLVLGALLGGAGLVGVTAAWAVSHLLAAGAGLLALRGALRRRGHRSWRAAGWGSRALWREFWGFTWLRGLARLAQIGMQRADILLVAAIVSPTGAAAYTVATRFVPLGQMATQAVQQVLQPRLTQILVHDDRRTLREVYRVATAWNMLLAWPLHLAVMALAVPYLEIFGDAARTNHARGVVVVMAAAMLVAVASGPVDTLLLMSGRSLASAGNAAAALVLDVVLCLLLLPMWGIVGAAVAWAAAVQVRCGLAFWQVGRSMRVHPVSGVTLRAAAVTVGWVAMPCWLLAGFGVDGWWLLLGLAACAGGYLVALHRTRAGLALDQAWAALGVRDREAWR